MLTANLSSVFFACRAAGPQMAKQGCGRIINVASGLGERGLPNCSAYCAAKGGVLNLTRALAQEWAAARRDRERHRAGLDGGHAGPGRSEPGDEPARSASSRCVGPGRPDEIGPLAVYLASDSAGYLTGRTIFVDGGLLAHL